MLSIFEVAIIFGIGLALRGLWKELVHYLGRHERARRAAAATRASQLLADTMQRLRERDDAERAKEREALDESYRRAAARRQGLPG